MSSTQPAETDPFAWFQRWMSEAEVSEPSNPNAMTVVTVRADGRPSARTILLKGVDPRGFVFYTNTHSRKGDELAGQPSDFVTVLLEVAGSPIRIEGQVESGDRRRADTYFATRPRISRLGAWASDQSRPLSDRAELERRLKSLDEKFPGEDIPRPPHWSGYRAARPFRVLAGHAVPPARPNNL